MSPDQKVALACTAAIAHFGEKTQLIQTCEELGELIQQVAKNASGRANARVMLHGDRAHLIDEMADVAMMMRQLTMIFAITDDELESMMEFKATRLFKKIERIKEGERMNQADGIEGAP